MPMPITDFFPINYDDIATENRLIEEALPISIAQTNLENKVINARYMPPLTNYNTQWIINNYSEFITIINRYLATAPLELLNDYYEITQAYSEFRTLFEEFYNEELPNQ